MKKIKENKILKKVFFLSFITLTRARAIPKHLIICERENETLDHAPLSTKTSAPRVKGLNEGNWEITYQFYKQHTSSGIYKK